MKEDVGKVAGRHLATSLQINFFRNNFQRF